MQTDINDPMDHHMTISKYDLMKRFDDIPVGHNIHIEGAPILTEFPTGTEKTRKVAFKKQISKNMSTFMARTKKWWAGLVSKRKISKPAMKSTTGAKFHKPVFKNLKHRTHFNKSKKFNHWNHSTVILTPMQHGHFARDLPTINVSKTQIIKNFDEIPVGPNVHFEGIPHYTAFPTGELPRKALPVGKQFKRDMNVFMMRVKKWWTGLKARKTIRDTSLQMKKQLRAPLIPHKRTHFDKSKKYNHWKHSSVLERPIREKIYVKDLPPAVTISRTQLIKNFDEVPVGAHVHYEGAPLFTAYPTLEMPRKHAPIVKQFSHDMSRFMTVTKRWWKGLQARRVIKNTGLTLKKQMWGRSGLKRTKFDKSKKFDHWSRAQVLDKPIRAGQVYTKQLPTTAALGKKLITKDQMLKNWDEVPVGVHLEGAPAFSEFPTASFKPKSRPVTKKIQKDLNSFLSRSKKYWRGLQSRRILKKGQLAMKKGMKKTFKLTKRTKFDKSKKFDHWNNAQVLAKPAYSDIALKKGATAGKEIKKPLFEESKADAFHSRNLVENKH